ncbi:MAG: hypothetical protein ABIK66_05440 [candidate division WOR-3 bacterium]
MKEEKIPKEKLDEKILIIQRCFGFDLLKARELALKYSDEQLVEMINQWDEKVGKIGIKKPETFPEFFYGKYYTIKNGKLEVKSFREEMRKNILEVLFSDQGPMAKQILEYILDQPNYSLDHSTLKARFLKAQNTITRLLGYNILYKQIDKSKNITNYVLYPELAPLIREIFTSEEFLGKPLFIVKTDAAKEELEEIKRMDAEFDRYLMELLENRIDDAIEFGKEFNIGVLANYLKELFGDILYFDSLLSIAQQYGMTDTEIINPQGGIASHTGFHLALFGAPGTGKTFAVKDMILGNPRRGVKAHGLPGRNRYCGGMTPAKFIRIGEAYQGRKFNFIVTEFNDWFKYRGMVEPLKLALEQGEIRFETKTESIGPYRFSSFFTTNYNTKIEGKMGYRVTISDPNFNAVEDRMIVRLHRMTKERYDELRKSQKKLGLGGMKFRLAERIRDHLTLVYAIQTEHHFVKDKFTKKKILARENIWDALDRASQLMLDALKGEQLPFSIRLESRTIQLAGTFALLSFFAQEGNILEIPPEAINLALRFYVEEAAIRAKGEIDSEEILERI